MIKRFKNILMLIRSLKVIQRKITLNQDQLITIWIRKELKSFIQEKRIFFNPKFIKKMEKLIFRKKEEIFTSVLSRNLAAKCQHQATPTPIVKKLNLHRKEPLVTKSSKI